MTTQPKILNIDAVPQLDPYHRDTGGETLTVVWIDLESGKCGVSQECDDNATPECRWNGRELAQSITRPNQSELCSYMRGDALPLIQRILDGSEIEWNGNNHVGVLDDDAQSAWEELLDDLDHLDESEYSFWNIEDWLQQADFDLAGKTDNELRALAKSIETDAKNDGVILNGDVYDYLIAKRDQD